MGDTHASSKVTVLLAIACRRYPRLAGICTGQQHRGEPGEIEHRSVIRLPVGAGRFRYQRKPFAGFIDQQLWQRNPCWRSQYIDPCIVLHNRRDRDRRADGDFTNKRPLSGRTGCRVLHRDHAQPAQASDPSCALSGDGNRTSDRARKLVIFRSCPDFEPGGLFPGY